MPCLACSPAPPTTAPSLALSRTAAGGARPRGSSRACPARTCHPALSATAPISAAVAGPRNRARPSACWRAGGGSVQPTLGSAAQGVTLHHQRRHQRLQEGRAWVPGPSFLAQFP
eukprot:4077348-Lingulodinium_polyedra.AAC.1